MLCRRHKLIWVCIQNNPSNQKSKIKKLKFKNRILQLLNNPFLIMPKKTVKQKDTPELFAKVFKVINGLKDKRNYITVQRVANEIHAKLEQMGLKPNSRNVLLQVRRALKYGVQKKLFLYKAGKYRLAIAESSSKHSTRPSRKEVIPMDSLELLKARKTKQQKRKLCSRHEHTSSCRLRNKKPNKRYLSRKCKSRYYTSNETLNSKNSINTRNSKNTKNSKVSKKSKTSKNSKKARGGSAEQSQSTEKTGANNSQETSSQNDIHHYNNKQEAIDKSKYGKHSRKSRVHSSSYQSVTISEVPKSRKNRKRKAKAVKELKDMENLTSDNSLSGLSTSTAIAAAIMIMMSLWYGYR